MSCLMPKTNEYGRFMDSPILFKFLQRAKDYKHLLEFYILHAEVHPLNLYFQYFVITENIISSCNLIEIAIIMKLIKLTFKVIV